MWCGVKTIGALSLLALWGCSDDKVAGFDTVETENAYIIKVVDSDSNPVKNGIARLRPLNYLPDMSQADDDSAAGNFRTDSLGFIRLDSAEISSINADSVIVEILSAGNSDSSQEGVIRRISLSTVLENLNDSLELKTASIGEISGNVSLPEGESTAWVQVYGTEHWAKINPDGSFTLEGLPPAEYDLRIVIGDSVQEISATVSSKETENVDDLVGNYLDIVDFEAKDYSSLLRAPMNNNEWYLAHQGDSVVTTPGDTNGIAGIEEAGAGRDGYAFHWKSSSPNGSWSNWGLWLCPSENPCNFTQVDSIVYYIRGEGRYSFALESLGDDNYKGKAIYRDTLSSTEEWIRKSIVPSDFEPGDSSWGNLGWDMISQKVTNLVIPAYGEAEVWIDDIRIYGINRKDFGE